MFGVIRGLLGVSTYDEIGDQGRRPRTGVILALPDLNVRFVLHESLVARFAKARAAVWNHKQSLRNALEIASNDGLPVG